MPNVMGVLKAEIARIARKEAKALVKPVSKPVTESRHRFADLKRRVSALEKANRALQALVAKLTAAQPAVPVEQADKARLTAKGIRSLRKRLGLSQENFARIVGVSGVAVFLWERQTGALRLRHETRAKLLAVRSMGAREAKERLEEIATNARPKTPKARRIKRKAGKRK